MPDLLFEARNVGIVLHTFFWHLVSIPNDTGEGRVGCRSRGETFASTISGVRSFEWSTQPSGPHRANTPY